MIEEKIMTFCLRAGLIYEKDGEDWCVHDDEEHGWIDLVESSAGFGDTILDALVNYLED